MATPVNDTRAVVRDSVTKCREDDPVSFCGSDYHDFDDASRSRTQLTSTDRNVVYS